MTVLLAARLWCWAAIVRPLKHVVSLATLVRLAHCAPRGSGSGESARRQLEAFLRRPGRGVARGPANCLERSLGAYRVLCAAGAAPELVVGVRRVENGMDGHVWVVVDGRPVAEEEAFLANFAKVTTFDAGGRRVSGSADPLAAGMRLS